MDRYYGWIVPIHSFITLSPFFETNFAANVNVVFQAQVIILDSPLSMLDPKGRRKVWSILKKYRPGRTILLTTQYMDEAEHLGNRVALMANGKLMCCGTSMFLKQIVGKGLSKVEIKKKIRYHFGNGWVGPGLNRETNWKSSQNCPILVLIFWGSTLCVFRLFIHLYRLLTVVILKKKFG